MAPEVIRPGGMSRMPMTAWALTLLPEPDSPRMASVSPDWRYQLTSRTACTVP
jgi:hypothetical protein